MLKTIILILQVICALGLISTILLQSGKSAGLSGSIAGAGETIFGGKKKGLDDLLAKITAYVAVLFMILTLTLAIMNQ
ncbi:preprotein translocase subunit SecG [Syntrophomonas wolfei]|uniref:Protein-export membrane protein SecG n=1 Tax=Syntrophomonas wolfei subsp. wolfei (strain DSM 2245B / Goettingen) TaxID=335541 RepID=Q0B079_SYNWW|nr:preprotein translocase subunit SecG [Syntrophomonas wolfei]ABI67625.1 preprotein translocase, SecG subunit [Syntrophomonas wolfei subsp. wolfei str. Goettingen G311]